jgi:tetratricopeptide (TPR) repeat protein
VKLRVRLLSIVLLACLGGALSVRAAETTNFFAQGITAYRAGEFSTAATAFKKSIARHPAPGAYLNLGLAEWQQGRAGWAMLAWERARWLDPWAARATGNLRFAREVLQVDDPELKWFEVASAWLPPDWWVWLAGVSLWMAVGLVTLPAFLRWRRAGWQQVAAAIFLCVFLFALVANFGVISRTCLGLVTRKDAVLRLTPTTEGEIITTLPAGESVRELRVHGRFSFIRTANAEGWIDRGQFQLISAE